MRGRGRGGGERVHYCNHVSGHALPVCAAAGAGGRVEARVPYTAVICCWRVKLFNPVGINHSRARPKFMHRSRGRMRAARLEIFAPRLPGRTVPRIRRAPACPRRRRANPAGSDSEDGATRFPPNPPCPRYSAIYGTRYSGIARFFLLFFFSFFSGDRDKFRRALFRSGSLHKQLRSAIFFSTSGPIPLSCGYRVPNAQSALLVYTRQTFIFANSLFEEFRELNEILLLSII